MKLSKEMWLLVIIMIVLTPLGMIAGGTAFGEWSTEELKNLLGYVPAGFSKLANIFNAVMPDYSIRGFDGGIKSYFGYFLSAVIGVGSIVLITLLLGKLIAGRENGQNKEK